MEAEFFLFFSESDGSVDVGPRTVFQNFPDCISIMKESYIVLWPPTQICGSRKTRSKRTKIEPTKHAVKIISTSSKLWIYMILFTRYVLCFVQFNMPDYNSLMCACFIFYR